MSTNDFPPDLPPRPPAPDAAGSPTGSVPAVPAPPASAPRPPAPAPVPPAPGPVPPAPGSVPPASGHLPPASGPTPSAGRVIAILVAALGGLAAIVTIGTAAAATVGSANEETITRTLDVDGISALAVEASAGTIEVAFGDVDEAVLDITSGAARHDWTFEVDGDTLQVTSPDRGWFDGPWFGGWMSGPTRATLTLPQVLDGELDAHLELAAGGLTATGDFGDLELDVSAGEMQVEGAADALNAELSAGRAELDLADVQTVELRASAGAMSATLTGEAPTDTTVDVSAGSLELTLPDDTYDVSVSESAGTVRNDLDTSSSATNTVDVSISAGSVWLRSR